MLDPMTMEIQHNAKAVLRAEMIAQRNAMTPEMAAHQSAAIFTRLVELPELLSARNICAYSSIGNEVQTHDFISWALDNGKKLALPRVIPNSRQMSLHFISGTQYLLPGPYNILQPPPNAPLCPPEEVDIFIIPGVAFDPHGNRLGYGAGYYDRILPASRGLRIALAYSFQLMPNIPATPNDAPMDTIVTETAVITPWRASVPRALE